MQRPRGRIRTRSAGARNRPQSHPFCEPASSLWPPSAGTSSLGFVAALATKREPVWPGDLPRGVRACGLLRRVMRFRLGWTPRFLPVAVVVVMLAFGGLLGIDGADAASLGSGAARVSYKVPEFVPTGARTVWAVTLAGSMNHPSQRVLRSVDGGARWSDVTPPGLPRAGTGTSLFSVDFASATWAWLAESEARGRSALLMTSDGGWSWTRVGSAPP